MQLPKSKVSVLSALSTPEGGALGNSAATVAARATVGLSRLAVLLVIARTFGPESFGSLALVISIVEILRTFSEFGIDTLSIRKFSGLRPQEYQGTLERVLGTKLLLACIFYGIALLVLLIVARSTDLVVLGAVVSLSLFSANLLGAFSAYFQSHLRMTMFLRSSLLCASFYVLASVLAIQYQLPITLVMAILPITEAFNVILLCRQVGWISPRIDFRQSVALVRESLPVGLMGAMIVLYFRIDSLIVFRIAGEAALGLYAVAYRIVEPILMVPHAFSLTAYAILSARKNQESSVSSLRIVIKAMWPAFVAVAIAASALVWGSGSLLSHILPDYIAAQALLQVLGVTLLVRTINLTLTAVINANGEYRALAKITGVNLCLNVGLALFLVPQWGALGAALSVLLTETANCAMQWTVVSSFGRLRQPTVGVPQVD